MEWLPLLGALFTLALGTLGLVAPQKIAGVVAIVPEGKLGLSEVRATYGGIFIGLGIACLLFRQPEVYVAVGLAWLIAAAARTISIFLDRAFIAKNAGGLVVEAGIGLLLVASVL